MKGISNLEKDGDNGSNCRLKVERDTVFTRVLPEQLEKVYQCLGCSLESFELVKPLLSEEKHEEWIRNSNLQAKEDCA